MNKRMNYNTDNAILIDIQQLAEMLNVGINTARRIGEEANARVKLGKAVRYDIDEVRKYLALLHIKSKEEDVGYAKFT